MSAMNAKSIPKIARFAIAGVVNTAFAYIAFATLTGLGCSDVLAVPAAMTAGVVFNFLSYGKMVFKSVDPRRLPRFISVYLCLCVCNVLGLRALAHLGLGAYGAQAMLVFPIATLAYVLNDRWVFRAD